MSDQYKVKVTLVPSNSNPVAFSGNQDNHDTVSFSGFVPPLPAPLGLGWSVHVALIDVTTAQAFTNSFFIWLPAWLSNTEVMQAVRTYVAVWVGQLVNVASTDIQFIGWPA